MQFYLNIFYQTLFFYAVEKENIDIIKLLLTCENLDINRINVFIFNNFIKFEIKIC